jgi:hypothetical protein
MSNITPYEKYNYDFFMFSRIATRAYLTRTEEAEHLDIFVQLIDLYEDFVKSDFNDVDETLESCMEQYVVNLID